MARVSPDTPCEHCGLPVGRRPIGEDPYFCCSGCQIVYEALHSAGLGETFYGLQGIAAIRDQTAPAGTSVDALLLSELETDAFLREHTKVIDSDTQSVELFLDGVHCAACVWLVERMPQHLEGVLDARLDLPRARLSMQWQPEQVSLSQIASWLAQFGYIAHPVRQQEQTERTEAERKLLVKVGVCWALAGNIMLIAFALYAGLDRFPESALAKAAYWMSLLLAVPAVIYGGGEFFKRAWSSVRICYRTRQLRSLHMDTPIALGIFVGTVDSVWATITGRGEIWFDSITVLIAALLTARWLQLRSRRLAGDATERLLALIPTMARRVTDDGSMETVRLDELQADDRVEVPAGEVFPVDGVVVRGQSNANNAVLTGESRPEALDVGDIVHAGATNLTSAVQITVKATGDATRVGQLLAWIRDASKQRAPVVLLADRLGGYFVITVIVLALATMIGWLMISPDEATRHVVALLVISCPCALGMATPLAMAVASGKAARAGIFIKSDEATQLLSHIDTIVLDKTGTLTEGMMTLVDYEGDEEAVDLAALLEQESNHPIAVALVQARVPFDLDHTQVERREVTSFQAFVGNGIVGKVKDREVVVGRPDWVFSRNHETADRWFEKTQNYADRGYTPVVVSIDGRVSAVMAIGDRLRDFAGQITSRLKQEGKQLWLLSGDHPGAVLSIAKELGIPEKTARGGLSPEQKKEIIERLHAEDGGTIAMVGDGVNDAAALQAADVGIAVHGGSTASIVAADVFLTRSGLQPVVDLLEGARHVMKVIRRNLGLSLVYNVIGATVAIAGWVSPLVAAVAMPISSLVVVTSSILQRSFSQESITKDHQQGSIN